VDVEGGCGFCDVHGLKGKEDLYLRSFDIDFVPIPARDNCGCVFGSS